MKRILKVKKLNKYAEKAINSYNNKFQKTNANLELKKSYMVKYFYNSIIIKGYYKIKLCLKIVNA